MHAPSLISRKRDKRLPPYHFSPGLATAATKHPDRHIADSIR